MPDDKRIFEKQIPYTIVRNEVFDGVMRKVSHPAWKVLCAIVRATMGWHKTQDRLSYAQIMERTGIGSPSTVSRAVDELIAGDYIKRTSDPLSGEANVYELNEDYILLLPTSTANVDPPLDTSTSSVDPPSDTSTATVEGGLQEMETQNKGKQRGGKKKVDLKHPALIGYRELARLNVPIAMRGDWLACAQEVGVEKLLAAVRTFVGRGWNPGNVIGMMDYARNGGKGGKGSKRRGGDEDPDGFDQTVRDRAARGEAEASRASS